MYKTIFIFLVAFFGSYLLVNGQESTKTNRYTTAIGARLGSPLSASVKHFIKDDMAIEATAGFRGYTGFNSVNISGSVQLHNPIEDVEGLSWYYGGGVGVYFWNYDNVFVNENSGSTTIGIQGYLGLDYRFDGAPVNLSIDWIPTFLLSGGGADGFGAGYGSLGVRYIINE